MGVKNGKKKDALQCVYRSEPIKFQIKNQSQTFGIESQQLRSFT